MRGYIVMWSIAMAVWAQQGPVAPGAQPGNTVPPGVPLRVALERRVAIKHVGDPIQGRLVEPVYVFDRMILAAGSIVEGHVAEIGGVPASRRLKAILSGDFTPARDVRSQFDTLVLSDGSRLPLRTSLSRGTAHTMRITPPRKTQGGPKSALRKVRDGIQEMDGPAIRAFRAPGKVSRLKSALFGMLPYHRQAWAAGTLFSSVLQEPLTGPPLNRAEARTDPPAAQPEDWQVQARLLHPVNSRTARRGELVEAEVTRPLFSRDRSLLIPEGSRLRGEVVDARAARRFHRNGRVFFVFRQLQMPGDPAQNMQGNLEGMEADWDAHVALDSEGAIRVHSPKTRFLFPAIAIAVTGLSFHQDFDAQGVPDQDIAGRAESGAVGLGLIGTLLAQTSRTLASGIAFAGAGFSLYSTFITRGEEVVLPANTPVKVSLKARRGEARR
jgi:hypothetical protein